MKKKILVVDIGGSNVKLMISAEEKRRKFPSGKKLAPNELITQIREITADWDYDAISVGFPSAVDEGGILKEPKNIGAGWMKFDFEKSLGKPTKVVNDAALQALGSYEGKGRMLFLGLGTGLGSALLWPGHVLSLELGFLPYIDDGILEDQLGDAGLERLGKKTWRKETTRAIEQLKISFIADRVVLGGGNAKLIEELPEGVELGHNRNVYPGGLRLWETQADGKTPKWRFI
ncbi:MAG TPA: ROK family protein [Chthoniobacterales bacterium]|jgi:predicted NBD/HSP70 family sugar kinase|nr:ROK family protein [Chthoniobacterales bacterium]